MYVSTRWFGQQASKKLSWPAEHPVIRMSGTTGHTSQNAQTVLPARPQRVKGRAYPLGYVEGLNDARTPLEGCFSILLGLHVDDVSYAQMH